MMKRLGRAERAALAEILLRGKTRASAGIVRALVSNGLIENDAATARDGWTSAKATARGRALFNAPAEGLQA